MLVRNEDLYYFLNKKLSNPVVEVHAIYEPDESLPGMFASCYMAAVDLFRAGLTHKIYFTMNEQNEIEIFDIERWCFG